MDQLRQGIIQSAQELGIDPVDLATAISYETAGTFNPQKKGPTTKWGQHKGLIQFGEPQAQKYGVDWKRPIETQLGKGGAVVKYLRDAGVKEGMGLLDIYSAINAGGVGLYNRSDEKAGGAKGTVRDKVEQQMSAHADKARNLIGDIAMNDTVSDEDFLNQVFQDEQSEAQPKPEVVNANFESEDTSDEDFLSQVFQYEGPTSEQQGSLPRPELANQLTSSRSIDPKTGMITKKENEVVVDREGNIRELGTKKTGSLTSQFLSGLPVDLKDRIAVFSKDRGIPENRYGLTMDGEIFYIDDNGVAQKEEGERIIDSIARSSGEIITGLGEVAGGIAGGVVGQPVAGATAGAALGDIARQKLAQFSGSQAEMSPLQTASEAAFALIPGVGEAGLAKYGNRKAVRELNELNLDDAQKVQDAARQQGISLTPAEATDSRSLKFQQQVLSQTPGSQDVMDDFYKKRNIDQIPQAIDNNISNIGNSYEGVDNFRNAVSEVTKSNITASQEKMRPLYNRVFKIAQEKGAMVDVTDLTQAIKSELVRLPKKSKTAAQYKRLMSLIDSTGNIKKDAFTAKVPFQELDTMKTPINRVESVVSDKKNRELSFDQANELKKAIDEFIDYQGIAQDKVTPRLKSKAMDVKNSLKDRMIEQVPEYEQTLAEAQKIITQLEKDNNPLSKFISKDDVLYGDDFIERGFHKMLQKGMPKDIAAFKRQFINNNQETAFNDGLASFLEDQFLKISDTADETVGAGIKFVNKIAKTPKQRMNLKAAMGADKYEGFEIFLDILQRTGKVKRTGAQTAPFQEVKEDIGSSATGGLMDYIKNIDITRPASLIPMQGTMKRFALEADKQYYKNLAQYLTTDRGLKSLKQLSEISPTSRKARKAVAYISAELAQKTQRQIKDRIDETQRQRQFQKEASRNVLMGNKL